MLKPIVFDKLSGGINFKQVDTLINSTTDNTEFAFIQNFTTYQDGGLVSQGGINPILTSVVDTSPIIAMAGFNSGANDYICYQKASGNIRFVLASGGAESAPVATGITAPCQFVQFSGKLVGVNGVDSPFTIDLSSYAAVTNPSPRWATIGQPSCITVHRNTRVLVAAANEVFLSSLGNANDWRTISENPSSDGFNAGVLFADFSSVSAVKNYGDYTVIHNNSGNIRLFAGRSPSDFATQPIVAPEAAAGKYAVANAGSGQWFITSRGVFGLSTTTFGEVQFSSKSEASEKIRPFFSSEATPAGNADPNQLKDSLLIGHPVRNELFLYCRQVGQTTFDGCFIYSFDKNSWIYRKTVPISSALSYGNSAFIGGPNGVIYKDFATNSLIAGYPFVRKMSTGFMSFGAPYNEKTINHFHMRFLNKGPVDLIFRLYTNDSMEVVYTRTESLEGSTDTYGVAKYGVAKYDSSASGYIHFPLPWKARTVKIELDIQNAVSNFQLLSFALDVTMGDSK